MDSSIYSCNSRWKIYSFCSYPVQVCCCNFASERQHRGQATIETVVLAGVLILLISVPVSNGGQTLMMFLTELVGVWANFQRALWDALALLPGVLR